MDVFIARQPIFDLNLNIYGYELLYRGTQENFANVDDADSATSDVIVNSLMLLGLEKVSDNKLSFINFTKDLIINEIPTIFDPKSMVVEILEDITPTVEFITSCRLLKSRGYRFALDDYVPQNFNVDLLNLVDIVKVDFMQLDAEAKTQVPIQLKPFGVKLLAEKVETYEEFEKAKLDGYQYFQGYFFQKPQVIQNSEIKESLSIYIKILKELNSPQPEFSNITNVIETDLSLAYKILKLVNSPAFYSSKKIDSIENALVRIGLKEIRKVISILMLRNINPKKPKEILQNSLVRAKFAELLALEFDLKNRSSEFFLMGLFSMIDSLIDQPIEKIIFDLPLNDDLKDALVGKRNRFRDVLDLIKLYERGYWELVTKKCNEYKIDELNISYLYLESLSWSQSASDV